MTIWRIWRPNKNKTKKNKNKLLSVTSIPHSASIILCVLCLSHLPDEVVHVGEEPAAGPLAAVVHVRGVTESMIFVAHVVSGFGSLRIFLGDNDDDLAMTHDQGPGYYF